MEDPNNLERRLSDQEVKSSALKTGFDSLVSSFQDSRDETREQFSLLHSELKNINQANVDNSKFPIANVLTSFGLIVIIIGGFYALLSSNSARVEHSSYQTDLRMEERSQEADLAQKQWILKAWDKLIEHTSDGHPAKQQEAIDHMKLVDQRIIETMVTKVSLTSELASIRTELGHLGTRATRSEFWDDRHDQEIPIKNSRQDTNDIQHKKDIDENRTSIVRNNELMRVELNKLHIIIGDLYKGRAKESKTNK